MLAWVLRCGPQYYGVCSIQIQPSGLASYVAQQQYHLHLHSTGKHCYAVISWAGISPTRGQLTLLQYLLDAISWQYKASEHPCNNTLLTYECVCGEYTQPYRIPLQVLRTRSATIVYRNHHVMSRLHAKAARPAQPPTMEWPEIYVL